MSEVHRREDRWWSRFRLFSSLLFLRHTASQAEPDGSHLRPGPRPENPERRREDMLDAHDMYSGEEEDFYSDDYKDSDVDDDGEPDYGFVQKDADDSAMIASHRSQVGSSTLLICLLGV
ncbi:hypothetical protein F2Q68_00023226 [Brassica cretica]|uniref:Uncharacterized protein n=2 Tax=Brassica cretica TaxID=69181 RepID=A0ABQ7D0X3_BRACR|nr:hypothetical protein F2Q68_00023226 [Brassica cretica]KAF3565911.1 hypothetical protein DY000_02019664 [Brassica cretica]